MEHEDKKELLLQVANRIKELRAIKKVSQEVASSDTGIHFGRIEQANRDIGVVTLKKICDYFEISINLFFIGIN